MSVKGKVARWYLTRRIRAAAEGEEGEMPQRIYVWLQGKKTITGLVLAFAAGGLEAVGHHDYAVYVGVVAGVLMQVGLLDKAWRAEPPKIGGKQ